MYSGEKWKSIIFTPFCHFFIGKNHEFLDELVSIISFSFFDTKRSFDNIIFCISISKIKIDLRRFKRNFSFFSSTFFEDIIEIECCFYCSIKILKFKYIHTFVTKSIKSFRGKSNCPFVTLSHWKYPWGTLSCSSALQFTVFIIAQTVLFPRTPISLLSSL